MRMEDAMKSVTLVLGAVFLSGCAASSIRRPYDSTVTQLRDLCRTQEVTAQDPIELDGTLFALEEEGGPDQVRWSVEFCEGHPNRKADRVVQKKTQISVARRADGTADYSVRCYEQAKFDVRDKGREQRWRTQIEALLNDAISSE